MFSIDLCAADSDAARRYACLGLILFVWFALDTSKSTSLSWQVEGVTSQRSHISCSAPDVIIAHVIVTCFTLCFGEFQSKNQASRKYYFKATARAFWSSRDDVLANHYQLWGIGTSPKGNGK